jgi:hypothetical protein
MAGGLVGVMGFFAVLWLTEPTQKLPPGVAILSNLMVSDAATLTTAIQMAELRGSADIRGAIDKIKRQDDGRVLIKGWVVDVAAKGTPLTVMAFAGGRNVLTMTTGGARHDLGHALGLAEAAATNPLFQSVVSCDHGRRLIVIAVTPSNTYGQLGSLVCP